jgi:hypothetical protein
MKLHKLYKLSVIVGNNTVERGVWADRMSIKDGAIVFENIEGETVALFPVQYTFITSIETAEEVEERKKAREESLASLLGDKYPRK